MNHVGHVQAHPYLGDSHTHCLDHGLEDRRCSIGSLCEVHSIHQAVRKGQMFVISAHYLVNYEGLFVREAKLRCGCPPMNVARGGPTSDDADDFLFGGV